MIQYLCVLDFEANCAEDMKAYKMDNEVIEFPSVLWKLENGIIENISEFQLFCKPKNMVTLTDFCKNLTGITQQQVNTGVSFPEALKAHEMWLRQNILDFDNNVKEMNVLIVTCGHWDLNVMAPKEYKNYNIHPHGVYLRYVNIKDDFTRFYKTSGKAGMAGMLAHANIQLEGKHHSGIDDCRNISKIIVKMINEGFAFEQFVVCYVDFNKK